MPLFYFDLADGTREPDLDGTELADRSAAEREAIRFMGEVLRHEPERLGDETLNVDLRDAERVKICTIRVIVERYS